MRYIEPPEAYIEKYRKLYAAIDAAGGMRITDIVRTLGASVGGAVAAIPSLEALGLYVWYEPADKKYRVMKREDEVMK